ncbi:hypothetical protein HDE79_002533 [Rhodanobacter sp. MP1X3]|nr:hypothetical protein [Rhodanobacter sp. MP1X3]
MHNADYQADPIKQRKARALALQRQRRHGVKRIDYHPNARALAIITAELKPYVGSDSSSVIDRLILKATGAAPELRHTSRRCAHAFDLAGPSDAANSGRPVCTRAKDFGESTNKPGIIDAIRAGASDFEGLPTWAPAYLSRCAARDVTKRAVCGGRRRSDGQPCEALSVPGKQRCKWHGGCSTGPRTVEGKARVTANLPTRSKEV